MRLTASLLVAALLTGCTREAPGRAVSTRASDAPPPVSQAALLIADGDTRVLTDRLRGAIRSPDVTLRRTAVRTLARLHAPEAAALLRTALRDEDSQVRVHASFGLADLSDELDVDLAPTILGALAAEPDRSARPALLRDLGRVGAVAALPAFGVALASEDASERAAACAGLGTYGLRRRAIPEDLLRRVATRSVDDANPHVRLLCTYALARLPAPASPDARRAVLAELTRNVGDESPDTRAQAARALSDYPETPHELLVALTRDLHPFVRIQAFHTLVRASLESSDRDVAAVLDQQLSRVLALPRPEGTEALVLLDALEAARPVARHAATYRFATDAFDRLGSLPVGQRTRAAALLHCAAAALVDHGRGWPSRLEHCGYAAVLDGLRKVEMADVIAAGSGSDELRAHFLTRLFHDSDERVREAVLRAVLRIPEPNATALILSGLEDGDFGVVTSACDAVLALGPTWSAPAANPSAAPAPSRGELGRAMARAHQRLVQAEAIEGLLAWLAAVDVAPMEFPTDAVLALARHPLPHVRRRAQAILAARAIAPPQDAPLPILNPIDPAALPPPDADLRVRIRTHAGDIVVRLEAHRSPVTTARFLALVDDAFYDGLTFHRVAPGFVVQGGDPRGDGYGGPGWTQRDELGRLPFVRGTVGIALAGRDTGGSQFFITTADEPQLDGRYTVLGRVLEGMDAVDALLPGATIESIRREPPP